MFLHLSVILFTGGCLPHPRTDTPLGRHPQADTPSADIPQADTPRQTPPWKSPLQADIPLGSHPPGRHPLGRPPRQTPLGRYPPGQTPPSPPSPCWDTHTPCPVHAGKRSISGRYAFHWNAFLLIFRLDISLIEH